NPLLDGLGTLGEEGFAVGGQLAVVDVEAARGGVQGGDFILVDDDEVGEMLEHTERYFTAVE
ncbi:hypothetical protein LTR16_012257, partial [Cryomyces antarcticus]